MRLALIGFLLIAAAGIVGAAETLARTVAEGAAAGAPFGPKGMAIGAAVAAVGWFTVRRWRRNRRSK